MQSRRRLKIGFPNMGKMFAGVELSGGGSGGKIFAGRSGRKLFCARPRRNRVLSSVSDATVRSRKEMSGATWRKIGAAAGGGILKKAGFMKKVREAVLRWQFGPATAISGLFVIAILLSLTYLAHFNQVATKGYDLRRLEADRQQLLNQYDIKNMKLAGVKSLSNIIASERVSAMRRPGEIVYVRANTALASR